MRYEIKTGEKIVKVLDGELLDILTVDWVTPGHAIVCINGGKKDIGYEFPRWVDHKRAWFVSKRQWKHNDTRFRVATQEDLDEWEAKCSKG